MDPVWTSLSSFYEYVTFPSSLQEHLYVHTNSTINDKEQIYWNMYFLPSFFFFWSKKWIYLERITPHRQSVGPHRRQEALEYGVVSSYGLGNFTGWRMGGWFQLFWKSGHFQELGHCPLFTFYGWLHNCHGAGGCVIQPTLRYYNECIMKLKVYCELNLLSS